MRRLIAILHININFSRNYRPLYKAAKNSLEAIVELLLASKAKLIYYLFIKAYKNSY
jgi:hypothetical protein